MAHKPWIREGLNREARTVIQAYSVLNMAVFQFTMCTSCFTRPWYLCAAGIASAWRYAGKKKPYTATTKRNAFGKLCWPPEKPSGPVVDTKTHQQSGNHIYHRNLSSVAPILKISTEKVPHWRKVVYIFWWKSIKSIAFWGSQLFYSMLLRNRRPPKWRVSHEIPEKSPKSSVEKREHARSAKNLAEYENGAKQNRTKIHRKYTETPIVWVFLIYFCPIFRGLWCFPFLQASSLSQCKWKDQTLKKTRIAIQTAC